MNPEVQQANPEPSAPPVPVETKPPQPTPQELYKRAYEQREQFYVRAQDAERLRRARRKGLFSEPSVEPTHEELVAAAPLPEDKIHYIHVATDRHGLPCLPKPRGRKRPHMTKRDQSVKSSSILVFRALFKNHLAKLAAIAKEKGEPFNGVPNDDLLKLGVAASIAGARLAKASRKAKRETLRKMKKLSRKINYGPVPGNINVAQYIN